MGKEGTTSPSRASPANQKESKEHASAHWLSLIYFLGAFLLLLIFILSFFLRFNIVFFENCVVFSEACIRFFRGLHFFYLLLSPEIFLLFYSICHSTEFRICRAHSFLGAF